MDLVTSLIEIQRAHHWTDGQMSARMGVGRVLWTQIRNRQKPISLNTLRAVAQEFPELREEVFTHLVGTAADPAAESVAA